SALLQRTLQKAEEVNRSLQIEALNPLSNLRLKTVVCAGNNEAPRWVVDMECCKGLHQQIESFLLVDPRHVENKGGVLEVGKLSGEELPAALKGLNRRNGDAVWYNLDAAGWQPCRNLVCLAGGSCVNP